MTEPSPSDNLALFDLDGTLTPLDTQLLFRHFVIRRSPWRLLLTLPFLIALPLGLARLLSTKSLKRAFLAYLWLLPGDKVRAWATEFAAIVERQLVFPEVRSKLAAHREKGHRCILNTASPEPYATPLGSLLGFPHVIATPLALSGRMPLLPVIPGPNNKGREKIHRMESILGGNAFEAAPDARISAYSDSHADLPLFSLAGHRFLVEPTARLLREASAWQDNAALKCTILRPRLPWKSRWGKMLLMLRLFCCLGPLPSLPDKDGKPLRDA